MSAAVTSRRALLTAGAATLAAGATLSAAAAASIGVDAELERLVAAYRAADALLDAADEAKYEASMRLRDLGGVHLPVPEVMFARESDKAFNILATIAVDHEDAERVRWHVSPEHVDYLRRAPRMRNALRWEPIPEKYRHETYVHRRMRDGVDEHGVGINEPWPEAQARADEIVAAYDTNQGEIARRRHVSGKNVADAAHADALSKQHEILTAVAMMPARTAEGMMLKLSVLMTWYDSADDLADDIERGSVSSDEMAYSIVRDLAKLSGRA